MEKGPSFIYISSYIVHVTVVCISSCIYIYYESGDERVDHVGLIVVNTFMHHTMAYLDLYGVDKKLVSFLSTAYQATSRTTISSAFPLIRLLLLIIIHHQPPPIESQ